MFTSRLRAEILFAATMVALGMPWSAQMKAEPVTAISPDSPPSGAPVDAAAGVAIPAPVQDAAVPWYEGLGPQQGLHRSDNTVNEFQRSTSDDGRSLYREHTVTNPQGVMTQTWQRSQTEEGYQFQHQQTWTAPDGTVRRQHEMTLSGTDPYNYQREMTVTLPGGRTMNMEQTRTWDGTSGTMERTFNGPNGQSKTFQRPWTPDDAIPEQPQQFQEQFRTHEREQAMGQNGQPSAVVPDSTSDVSPPPADEGFWNRLNPFRSSLSDASKATSDVGRRRGFTVGAGNAGNLNGHHYGLTKRQPGQVELPGQAAARSRANQTNPGLGNAKGQATAAARSNGHR